uniref:Uncharacterized protein n=1 Tax=Anguilla anguilla TaxID=7936 RepID=A0A0E9X7A8_ANGAN
MVTVHTIWTSTLRHSCLYFGNIIYSLYITMLFFQVKYSVSPINTVISKFFLFFCF